MNRRLGGVSAVKFGREDFADTGTTNDMGPNYGSFMSYHPSYSGEYVILVNGREYPTEGYITSLVILGGGGGL